jgi:chromosome segregation ATPase
MIVAALKNLFGKDSQLDKLPAELKPLVDQMRRERAAYEALVKRAEQVSGAVAPLEQQITQLEQRLAGFDKLSEQLATFEQKVAAVEVGQQNTMKGFTDAEALAKAVRNDLDGLKGQLDDVATAKAELPGLLELVKPLGALRSETSAMDQRMQDLSSRLEQMRERQEQTVAESTAAQSRLAGIDEGLNAMMGRVEGFAARADGLEATVEQLRQLLKEVPEVKRDLSTLNVLAEYVTQKVATLEGQKEMVERAMQRAERLTELTAQVDRQLQAQHEDAQFLERLAKNVDEIKKMHEAALQRADEIEKTYTSIDAERGKLAEQFAAQRDALQQATGVFKFEREGLDVLSQRVTELRAALGAIERELPTLDGARGDLSNVAAEVKRLGEATAALARQMAELQSTAESAQEAQAHVRQLQESVGDLAHRMESLAPAQLTQELDERARQMDEVRSRVGRLETQLTGWETLEQRTGRALELAEERHQAVAALRSELQRLFEVADSTVAQVRTAVEMQHEIEQRQHALEPVLERLRDLDRQSEAMEERQQKLADAEERLTRLDALLIDLQSTFQAVLEQKAFLERVVETAGNLALQTMQAEAAIATLREATQATKGKRH